MKTTPRFGWLSLLLVIQAACSAPEGANHGGSMHSGSMGSRRDVPRHPDLDSILNVSRAKPAACEILRTIAVPGRLSGSRAAAESVRRSHRLMELYGFDNVRLEPVRVPVWQRRLEVAEITSGGAGSGNLQIAALGGSPPTPAEGIEANVVEVRSEAELQQLGDHARGKIIFYNQAMDRTAADPFKAYGAAVWQRSRGAYEASKLGAVAVLVRSMTTTLDDHPHTGQMRPVLEDGRTPVVPAAAVSTRSAELLRSLLQNNPDAVRVRMRLDCGFLPDADSHNVIGEITGSSKPGEIVLVVGHLDAWDKGDGAHDDGAGCAHAMEALRLIREAGLRPKRTIRCVLFMNEENGLAGGRAYAEAHDAGAHLFAIESDRGGFAPLGVQCPRREPIHSIVQNNARFLAALGAGTVFDGGGGADISPLERRGVICGELIPDPTWYFHYHHCDADVVEAVDPRDLERGAVVLAFTLFTIANH